MISDNVFARPTNDRGDVGACNTDAAFLRDVHDLLGSTLYAIALRAELTRRMKAIDPDGARFELMALVTTIERALSESHSLGAGLSPPLELREELARAASLLQAAEVELLTWGSNAMTKFPQHLQTTFALILRECVTNLLKHSEATRCSVVLRATPSGYGLSVFNDGVHRLPSRVHQRGLSNLAHRVRCHGGQLAAGGTRSWFMVRASAPPGDHRSGSAAEARFAGQACPDGSRTPPAAPGTRAGAAVEPAPDPPALQAWYAHQIDPSCLLPRAVGEATECCARPAPAAPAGEQALQLASLRQSIAEYVTESLQESLSLARRSAELMLTSPTAAAAELKHLVTSARSTLAAIHAVVHSPAGSPTVGAAALLLPMTGGRSATRH